MVGVNGSETVTGDGVRVVGGSVGWRGVLWEVLWLGAEVAR